MFSLNDYTYDSINTNQFNISIQRNKITGSYILSDQDSELKCTYIGHNKANALKDFRQLIREHRLEVK
jgi:hypothetical protein